LACIVLSLVLVGDLGNNYPIYLAQTMDPIISTIAVQAGKQLINFLNPEKVQKPVNQVAQMERFENRLEQSMNPEKADFESFLDANHVSSVPQLDLLANRLKQQLMQDGELRTFLNSQPLNAEFTLNETEAGWGIQSDSNAIYHPQDSGVARQVADKLEAIESVLQLASLQPQADLASLVDQAFDLSTAQPNNNTPIALNQ